ncbi:hypothetical protein H6764_02420 [Candidatus Nomurabacteria bacterium]|nr:hypothetical protein [Candidatus Nomurabacteria bacterium]
MKNCVLTPWLNVIRVALQNDLYSAITVINVDGPPGEVLSALTFCSTLLGSDPLPESSPGVNLDIAMRVSFSPEIIQQHLAAFAEVDQEAADVLLPSLPDIVDTLGKIRDGVNRSSLINPDLFDLAMLEETILYMAIKPEDILERLVLCSNFEDASDLINDAVEKYISSFEGQVK